VLLGDYWGGDHPGSLITLIRLARPLIYLNHEVSAFSISNNVDAPHELDLKGKFIGRKKLIALWLQYWRLSRTYDISYNFSCSRLQLPYLTTLRSTLPKLILDLNVDTIDYVHNPLVKGIIRKILKISENITTPSQYYKWYLIKNWRVPPEKIKHIYYSVSNDLLTKEADSFRSKILTNFGLDPLLNTVIHAGQVTKFQIEVYLRLMKMFNLNLLMIGPDLNRQEVIHYVRLLESKYPRRFKAIKKYLPYDIVCKILKASDLFIVYYDRHMIGHPQKLYDYMAAGKPIIANKCLGINDIINDENAVLIDNEGDVLKKYIDAASEVIQDETKAKIMGCKARDFAFKNFRTDIVAEKLKEIF